MFTLTNKEISPSTRLKKINRVITTLSFRNNPVVWNLAVIIFPLDYYLAYLIESYKEQVKKLLPEWLEVRNKLEVFISLANYAYLNPDNSYPELLDGNNQIHFKAEQLGHPLIPFDQKKTNNFELHSNGNISIITGSNMSGKSTFLRTIGINVCLAYAGAPVDAKYMSIGMMKLFTCIKVSDSIVDGISYFYAEVQRLKQLILLLEKENKYPVLFLIDEIFKGTNNRERLIGSRSMIKSLLNKKGAGLISTHDLELIHLADENAAIKNYHFKEDISEGKMIFDYTLREGPCPSTNALEIMRINGLPVE
jgi:DNA mismatch repair ATPase MutS